MFKKNRSKTTNTKFLHEDLAINEAGFCGLCITCGLCETGKRGKTGRTLFPEPFGTAQFSGTKEISYLNEINILPELWGDNFFFKEVETSVELGGFKAEIPISVAAMGSTKVAFTKNKTIIEGTAKFGIPYVIGENILNTYGKEALEERFKLYQENRKKNYGAFIIQGNYIETKLGIFDLAKEIGVDGIEIKIGQGAKQGLGGEIQFEDEKLAEKYRKLGYLILEEEVNGKKIFQRHTPPGELKEDTIENIITKYDFNKIWIKTGIGRGIIKLVEKINELNERYGNIKALTIDGYYGGTGMSPWLIMNEMSIPSLTIFKHLEEEGIKPKFDLIMAGGYSNGLDVAKALLFGAKGVAMGRAFNIVASSSENVYNFLKAIKEELQMVSTILKRKDLKEIIGKKEYLVALTKEAEEFYGIPCVGHIKL